MGTTPFIQIKDLQKDFKSKNDTVTALSGINLNIDKGTIFGIIGMSGAGKSTLVRCINFLERPTKGTIIIGDKDLSLLSDSDLRGVRQNIGMIFQHFNLLMQRTVEDNISFPLEIAGYSKREGRKRAGELLDLVGLSDKRRPTLTAERVKTKSCNSKGSCHKPRILLCDEATSALTLLTVNTCPLKGYK